MELSVVPLVIRSAVSADWLRFDALLARMKLSLEEKSLADFGQADREFHELLVEATHNPLLQMLRPMIRWIFDEVLRSSVQTPRSCKKAFEEHQAIAQAMRSGRVAQARKVLEAHLRCGLKSLKASAGKRR